ncbi:MAG: hypothetical protein OHK93_006456 [Ramalina farinacea]|uniref:Uncharacterized protein n=1 Tax=Ramalina farinacea TaxID=258253 RepID=A0AA43TT27_9LECA|nr:hypothetical protein [Ramalina farinacea]
MSKGLPFRGSFKQTTLSIQGPSSTVAAVLPGPSDVSSANHRLGSSDSDSWAEVETSGDEGQWPEKNSPTQSRTNKRKKKQDPRTPAPKRKPTLLTKCLAHTGANFRLDTVGMQAAKDYMAAEKMARSGPSPRLQQAKEAARARLAESVDDKNGWTELLIEPVTPGNDPDEPWPSCTTGKLASLQQYVQKLSIRNTACLKEKDECISSRDLQLEKVRKETGQLSAANEEARLDKDRLEAQVKTQQKLISSMEQLDSGKGDLGAQVNHMLQQILEEKAKSSSLEVDSSRKEGIIHDQDRDLLRIRGERDRKSADLATTRASLDVQIRQNQAHVSSIQTLRGQNEYLQVELVDNSTEIKTAKEELAESRKKLAVIPELEQTLQQRKKEVEAANGKIEELEQGLQQRINEVETGKGETGKLEQSLQQRKKEVETGKGEIEKLQQTLQQCVNEVKHTNGKFEKLEQILQQRKKEVEAGKGKIEKLAQTLQQRNKEVETGKGETGKLQQTLQQRVNEVGRANRKIEELEQSLQQRVDEVGSANRKITGLEQTLQRRISEVKTAKGEFEKLEMAFTDVNKKRGIDDTKYAKEVRGLKSQIEQLSSNLEKETGLRIFDNTESIRIRKLLEDDCLSRTRDLEREKGMNTCLQKSLDTFRTTASRDSRSIQRLATRLNNSQDVADERLREVGDLRNSFNLEVRASRTREEFIETIQNRYQESLETMDGEVRSLTEEKRTLESELGKLREEAKSQDGKLQGEIKARRSAELSLIERDTAYEVLHADLGTQKVLVQFKKTRIEEQGQDIRKLNEQLHATRLDHGKWDRDAEEAKNKLASKQLELDTRTREAEGARENLASKQRELDNRTRYGEETREKLEAANSSLETREQDIQRVEAQRDSERQARKMQFDMFKHMSNLPPSLQLAEDTQHLVIQCFDKLRPLELRCFLMAKDCVLFSALVNGTITQWTEESPLGTLFWHEMALWFDIGTERGSLRYLELDDNAPETMEWMKDRYPRRKVTDDDMKKL